MAWVVKRGIQNELDQRLRVATLEVHVRLNYKSEAQGTSSLVNML